MSYIGRFAPSPTGPLHFGSLTAAVASYLEAKLHQGTWLLRMEDLDRPREAKGAASQILSTLEAFGFEWHGAVIYQSQRTEAYTAMLNVLLKDQLIYPCICSRKEIADSAGQGLDGFIYPGTCKQGLVSSTNINNISADTPHSWRIQTNDSRISFHDKVQGEIYQNLATDIGDFILKRADGIFAYQLAVVIDDAYQGVTHVVRGADLLDSTPRQLYLQQILGFTQPSYAHIPVVTNQNNEKLSKQTLARALDTQHASSLLWQALVFLGQCPPVELQHEPLNMLWHWAESVWNIERIPQNRTIQFLI